MKKIKAVMFVLLLSGIVYICCGCGKEAAQIALGDETESISEEPEGDEESGDSGQQDDATAQAAPVVEVICNCQCNGAGPSADGEVPAEGGAQTETVIQQPVDDGKVNINTADAAELQTLNGIGASRAQAIISYRESYGQFQSIEEIKNVDGIKDGVYNKIKDEISVGR